MRFVIKTSFGQVVLKIDILFVYMSKFGKYTKYISQKR